MRNLKKVLAMALALVMSLSLVTIANAADFSDDADISYKEAVDVMSAIGVINGYEDGSFQPDGILTREEAAKLICTMLLGSGADRLGTTSSSFTDVAATRWSAPYIEYCNSLGIIAGNGDGTFDPTGELTGHAFAKMLLVALGYDSAREGYTGAGWSIEVAKDAITAGIDVDGVAMSAEVTREVAAQMAFNTLEATMVEYATAGTVVTAPDGTTVVTSGSNASKVENNANRAGYDGEKDGYQQFCEEYFDDLEKNTSATDKYSRPAVAWEYDNEDVGTYAKEADASYTEKTEVRDIYSDLGLDGTVKKADIALFEDGVEGTASHDISKRGDEKYGARGALMEVYYDKDAEEVTICIVNTFLGIVTDDDYTSDGDDGILVQVYDETGSESGSYFLKNGAYEQDTVLLVQVADDEIQAVVGEPETVEGSLTRISDKNEVTLGGTKYAVANQFTTADNDVIEGKDTSELEIDEDITYTLYLDQYGNYIAAVVAEDSSESDLVYVYNAYVGTVLDGSQVKYGNLVQVVRMDGTTEELLIGEAKKTDDEVTDSATYTAMKGGFAELSYDEGDDIYELAAVDKKSDGTIADGKDYASVTVPTSAEFEEDDVRISLSNKTFYLDDSTTYIFISKDGSDIDEVTVISGGVNYKPTVAGIGAYASGRDMEAIVFEAAYEATSDNVIYFAKNTEYSSRVAKDVYSFEGYAVGESSETEFEVSKVGDSKPTTSTKLTGFYKYTEDADGYLKLTQLGTGGYGSFVDDEDSYFKATSMDEIKNGVLTFNTDETALISGAVVVDLTDADDDSENTYGRNVNSVSALQRIMDNDYTVTAELFINKDNEVEAVYITKIAGNDRPDGGDEDETTYKLATAPTVSLASGKVNFTGTVIHTSEDSAPSEAINGLTVTVTVEERVSGAWTTLDSVEQTANVDTSGNLSVTSANIGVVAGTSYRVSITLSGDDFGTMTLYSGTISF